MADWRAIVFVGRLVGPTFYTKQFIGYAKDHNIETYVVDVNDESTYCCDEFDAFAQQPGTIVFTYNNIGLWLKDSDGENYWKANDIPVFNFIIDHPRNFDDMLMEPECDIYLFVLDRNYLDFVKKFYPKLKGVFFVPHAGAEIKDSYIPYADRKIDVLYMGSCQGKIDKFPVLDAFDDGGSDLYQKVSMALLSDPLLSTEKAVMDYVSGAGISLSKEAELKLLCIAGRVIDRTLRRMTKLSGMQALDRAGIKVEVYGDEWIDEEYPLSDNITIHERIGREELLDILCNSKISVCYIPWFRGGCSEKNLDCMINGTVCVTDRSEYLLEHYEDGKDIVYFDIGDPDRMAEDVKWLLDHPKTAAVIAANGQKKARKYDSWDVRHGYICDIISGCLT